jgi:hypothetical protein
MRWTVDDFDARLAEGTLSVSTTIRYVDDFSGKIMASRMISTSISINAPDPKSLIVSQLTPQLVAAKADILKEVSAKQALSTLVKDILNYLG